MMPVEELPAENTESRQLQAMPVIVAAVAVVALIGALLFVRAQRARLYPAQLLSISAEVVAPRAVADSMPRPSRSVDDGAADDSAVASVGLAARTIEPYRGLGAWLDAFDYSPNYAVEDPPLTPAVVEEMAAANVKTIFIQAARNDERSPGLLEDRWLLTEILVGAHERDIAVVAWYLPKLVPGDPRDIQQLQAMIDFEILGHRFDGIAVDIEAEPEPSADEVAVRNAELIRLSKQLRIISGDDTLGAIVLPPPLIEDVNDQFWPEFPWADIGPLYDVWLPMSYWSGRSNESGYGDGYNYNAVSTRRIREHIGQPGAPVHGIGGIGGVTGERDFSSSEILAAAADLPLFAESLRDTNSIGGSIYDWQTLDAESRVLMTELFTTGPAAELPTG